MPHNIVLLSPTYYQRKESVRNHFKQNLNLIKTVSNKEKKMCQNNSFYKTYIMLLIENSSFPRNVYV